MRQELKMFIPIFILALGLLLSMSFTMMASAESESAVDALPDQMLFNIENMKPGDWSIKTYTISNKHQKADYVLTSQFSGGSEKLYNQLQLSVKQGEDTLFHGQLLDFQNLDINTPVYEGDKQFEFRIDFPFESGNEFQGLVTHFNILLQSEDRKDNVAGHDDNRLPNTASMIFTYFLIGIVFLLAAGAMKLFHTRKNRSKCLKC